MSKEPDRPEITKDDIKALTKAVKKSGDEGAFNGLGTVIVAGLLALGAYVFHSYDGFDDICLEQARIAEQTRQLIDELGLEITIDTEAVNQKVTDCISDESGLPIAAVEPLKIPAVTPPRVD